MSHTHFNVDYFFDAPAVRRMVEQLGPQGPQLAKAGAMLRTIARGLIRRRKKKTTTSPPGSPPYSKDPAGRYKRIEYYFDHAQKAVIVGHVSYPSKGGGYVPDTHEFGRTARVARLVVPRKKPSTLSPEGSKRRLRAFKRLINRLRSGDRDLSPQALGHFNRDRVKPRIRWETATYKRRPTMGPALEQGMSRLPGIWAKSLVK